MAQKQPEIAPALVEEIIELVARFEDLAEADKAKYVQGAENAKVGDIAFVDAFGSYRRGVVTKVGRTRIYVSFTTRGAIDDFHNPATRPEYKAAHGNRPRIHTRADAFANVKVEKAPDVAETVHDEILIPAKPIGDVEEGPVDDHRCTAECTSTTCYETYVRLEFPDGHVMPIEEWAAGFRSARTVEPSVHGWHTPEAGRAVMRALARTEPVDIHVTAPGAAALRAIAGENLHPASFSSANGVLDGPAAVTMRAEILDELHEEALAESARRTAAEEPRPHSFLPTMGNGPTYGACQVKTCGLEWDAEVHRVHRERLRGEAPAFVPEEASGDHFTAEAYAGLDEALKVLDDVIERADALVADLAEEPVDPWEPYLADPAPVEEPELHELLRWYGQARSFTSQADDRRDYEVRDRLRDVGSELFHRVAQRIDREPVRTMALLFGYARAMGASIFIPAGERDGYNAEAALLYAQVLRAGADRSRPVPEFAGGLVPAMDELTERVKRAAQGVDERIGSARPEANPEALLDTTGFTVGSAVTWVEGPVGQVRRYGRVVGVDLASWGLSERAADAAAGKLFVRGTDDTLYIVHPDRLAHWPADEARAQFTAEALALATPTEKER